MDTFLYACVSACVRVYRYKYTDTETTPLSQTLTRPWMISYSLSHELPLLAEIVDEVIGCINVFPVRERGVSE